MSGTGAFFSIPGTKEIDIFLYFIYYSLIHVFVFFLLRNVAIAFFPKSAMLFLYQIKKM